MTNDLGNANKHIEYLSQLAYQQSNYKEEKEARMDEVSLPSIDKTNDVAIWIGAERGGNGEEIVAVECEHTEFIKGMWRKVADCSTAVIWRKLIIRKEKRMTI